MALCPFHTLSVALSRKYALLTSAIIQKKLDGFQQNSKGRWAMSHGNCGAEPVKGADPGILIQEDFQGLEEVCAL